MGKLKAMLTNAERAGEIVKERRLALDMNQLDVQAAGGPSNSKMTDIENGRMEELTANIAKKLDRGLRWQKGSARRVWAGGDPVPADQDENEALVLLLSEVDDQAAQDRIKEILKARGVVLPGAPAVDPPRRSETG